MPQLLQRKNYARIPEILDLPDLIEIQLNSFNWFRDYGLHELFDEISPIESYNGGIKIFFPGTSKEAREFGLKMWFGEIKYDQDECLDRDLTFAAPLYVKVLLTGDEVPEPIVSDIFMGDFPIMTEKGTFIINGTERVVVSQLIRSPGVYFDMETERSTGRRMSTAKLIPDRGAWMEFETRKSDYLTIKFNRKRTVPVTMMLRALAAVTDSLADEEALIKEGSDDELIGLFAEFDTDPDRQFIASTIRQEPEWEPTSRRTVAELALVEFYKRMRPGDPPTLDNAREYLTQQLFDQRRYDTERVGRYKLNQKLGHTEEDVPLTHRTITQKDLVALVRRMIQINNNKYDPDDVDHLGNRRVKTVGELIQAKMRVGLRRTERVIRERMSIRSENEPLSPVNLINIRPIVASVREFFGSSQLSQFMDQTNPLAELRHKRTISALGPGGLRRERAGFDVRDVHHSHYGRICPIETPEGPNIGLIGRLASYARVNAFGFIETPYRRVVKHLIATDPALLGREAGEDITDAKGKVIVEKGVRISEADLPRLKKLGKDVFVSVKPFVSSEFEYLSADTEDKYVIAQGNTPLDGNNEFISKRPSCRYQSKFLFQEHARIDYMDVAPRQIVGISASLIPFLSHDDANRALMGSNMMSQAVPLLRPEVPTVGTGMEEHAARDSGQVVIAEADGEVVGVTGGRIIVQHEDGSRREYRLRKFERSNQSTSIDQRPIVTKGQMVQQGQVIADSSSTDFGGLALGQNVLVAYMSWEGGNFEDAILISERLIRDDKFTSIHVEKHEVEARDTKLGPEEITFDIPNVGEDALKDLDERGIVRIGAEVGPNDILVGKITPKGEKELTPEEKLLRAIFGEKAREVKDTSMRMPHGQKGTVVDVRVFDRDEYRDLQAGVEKMVRVSVAERRKLTEGDKMAGRHGNKGVISKIVPIEDMPYLEDGTPIDIILSPLGVPGRMNIGQIFETHLGWAALRLGFRAVTPVFDGAKEDEIEAELGRAWLIDRAWYEIQERAWEALLEQDYDPEMIEDDEQAIKLYIEAWIGDQFNPTLLATDRIYTRRAVLRAWLAERGYDPDSLLAFDETQPATEIREARDAEAVRATLIEWLRVQGVEHDIDPYDVDAMRARAIMHVKQTGAVLPLQGKMKLINGFNGEPYDTPITVGIAHMLKLHHLVEDKVHARSTGPYSLVTQQPLGGKAQFGGQRFGEMEVWALEAYGAAYMLQEMLTVKSDDTQGRVKTYESIVKGEPIEAPGIPASFKVLVKELQSLGLAVEAVTEDGDVIKFGKDEEKHRQPRLGGLGLLGFAPRAQREGTD